MASSIPKLDAGTFQNWLKLGLALYYTREGIKSMVIEDAEILQKEILKEIYTQKGVRIGSTCASCSIENVLPCPTKDLCNRVRDKSCTVHKTSGKQYRACPSRICDTFVERLRQAHRFTKPSWKNSRAQGWCSDAVELVKCFMPRDGYSEVSSFQEVDFNGLINVIINNKRLENNFTADLSQRNNVATRAREIGKVVRHSPDLSVEDSDLEGYMDILVHMLSDIKCRLNETPVQDAINMIQQLRIESLSISTSDVTKVIGDVIDLKTRNQLARELKVEMEDLKGEMEGAQKQLVGDLKEEMEDLKEEMEGAQKQLTGDMKVEMEGLKEDMEGAQISFLQDVVNAIKDIDDKIKGETLNEIVTTKLCAIAEIKSSGNKEMQSISAAGRKEQGKLKQKASHHRISLSEESKKIKQAIETATEKAVSKIVSTTSARFHRISESEKYEAMKNDLRRDLIQLCRKQHISLPVSPLREENEAPLLHVYVAPALKCKEYEKGPYCKQDVDQTTPVTSYTGVFFKDSKECQDIYLAAPAGSGKTSYVKRMALAWCYAHSPDETQKQYFTPEEVGTIKSFDFLFLISLREVFQNECDIDAMIQAHVVCQLSQSFQYCDEFLQEILHLEKCLILIDGLDEWSHPIIHDKECSDPTAKIPHRKVREKCTILTTTRPWKLESMIVGCKYFIDKHLEMRGLEEKSANKLVNSALNHLNSKYNEQKSSTDFNSLLKQNRVNKLKSIPLLLLQMLCLWFVNGRLGNSQCEIYSNMLQFLFSLAAKRTRHEATCNMTKRADDRTKGPPDLPNCFSNDPMCIKHKHLLLHLGKLAFDGLFGVRPESSLVFNETVVQEYLDTDMIKLCNESGILSQNNACRKLLHAESSFSFIHKTYQEFLAALYISLEWSEDIQVQMFNCCTSIDKVLQVSKIFLFISGMNQEISGKLSRKCSEVVSRDEGTVCFRRNIGTLFIKSRVCMHRFHNLMLNCVQESKANGFDKINVIAQDIFISDKCNLERLLENCSINKNLDNIRSLDIRSSAVQENVHQLFHSLDVYSLRGLQKLYIWGSLFTQDIVTVIRCSSASLICLELWDLKFTDNLLDAVKEVGQLEALSLLCIPMSHNQIEDLMKFLRDKCNLRQLSLNEIICIDHGSSCEGYTLNLSNHSKLEMLLLDKVHVTQVTINSQKLFMCVVEWLYIPGALASILDGLEHATHLERFECDGAEYSVDLDKLVEVLPILVELKYVKLRNINLANRHLHFNQNEKLECIYMWRVITTADLLKQLLNKVNTSQRTVTVMLDGCEIKPEAEYEKIMKEIKESSNIEVIRDTNSATYHEFYFKTREIAK